MASPSPRALVIVLVLSLLAFSAPAANSLACTTQKLTDSGIYSTCLDLPALGSTLHYSYNAANSSAAVAFITSLPESRGWVSWALNPTGTGMVGCQALIAFKDASTGAMAVKTYNVSSYGSVEESKISFEVWDMAAESATDGTMRIYAKIKVPGDASKLNQVWQVGPSVTDGVPDKHDFAVANLVAKGTLNLVSGQTSSTSGDSGLQKKNIHGILNVVSWGILFPFGIIIARYLRVFPSADPTWFYLHVFCQFSAYVIGSAGWGSGLSLGGKSEGIIYSSHRNLGIAIFCMSTIQMFALLVRPKKDHKYRFYWNIYHHGFGYSIIIIGIVNVFKGYDILRPAEKWKSRYITTIAALVGFALLLEVVTWMVVLKRGSYKSTRPSYDGSCDGQSRQDSLAL
ncbi:hypothetical protein SAY86_006725 [Trapa natans]|uniref:Cytochrome b561 and DOMON domain-containing protein n=1 Tax=Trapa natans TaxID=22666 RepID=A0AAN7LER0_TRANT|nr:hypothetical protein SAY86_006725 [Trapa natans]